MKYNEFLLFFFFQAEDGIRDYKVTGVQTCALPISERFAGFGKMDVVYCDIAQRDQTGIAIANARKHLKEGGTLLLVVKARSIDGLKEPAQVFREEAQLLRDKGFAVEKVIDLRPYDKDHALISATMR